MGGSSSTTRFFKESYFVYLLWISLLFPSGGGGRGRLKLN